MVPGFLSAIDRHASAKSPRRQCGPQAHLPRWKLEISLFESACHGPQLECGELFLQRRRFPYPLRMRNERFGVVGGRRPEVGFGEVKSRKRADDNSPAL